MRRFILIFIAFIALAGCGQNNKGYEKHQSIRNNMLAVNSQIAEFVPDNIISGRMSYLKIMGNYIVIADLQATDSIVHVFNKNTLKYIGSVGVLGQGPGEIASIAGVAFDGEFNVLQVADYGNMKIYGFEIKEIDETKDVKPSTIKEISKDILPYEYHFVNDTLSIGSFIIRDGVSNNMKVGAWNMRDNSVKLHDKEYPGIEENVVVYDYSNKHDLIVECSNKYDLINIFDGQLNLKTRVYGPEWEENGDNKQHFLSVVIYKDWIIAAYDGKDRQTDSMPTICHVFDLDGNYIKTLDIGYKIWRMSVDEDNDRLYLSFQDEIQFGYLDLKEILD